MKKLYGESFLKHTDWSNETIYEPGTILEMLRKILNILSE
jgi:hypothetical protein